MPKTACFRTPRRIGGRTLALLLLPLLLALGSPPAAAQESGGQGEGGTAAPDNMGDGKAAYLAGNYEAAFRLWKPIAEAGNADAQYNLGNLYRAGQGVPRDMAQAAEWYTKAAAQGVPNAQYNLGLMYATGDGVRQDLVLAYMWFDLASRRFPISPFRDQTIANRDEVGGHLSEKQLAEARRLISIWEERLRATVQ